MKYLNDTYGPEKFAQLFAEIKGGKRIDAALEAVYGFDQDGLDNEWRAANGLAPRETPEPHDEQPQSGVQPVPRPIHRTTHKRKETAAGPPPS